MTLWSNIICIVLYSWLKRNDFIIQSTWLVVQYYMHCDSLQPVKEKLYYTKASWIHPIIMFKVPSEATKCYFYSMASYYHIVSSYNISTVAIIKASYCMGWSKFTDLFMWSHANLMWSSHLFNHRYRTILVKI